MKKILMLLGAAILVAGVAAVAREHGGHEMHMRHGGPGMSGEGMDRHLDYMADKLDLTAEQKEAAKKLHEGVENEVRGIFDQQREIHESIEEMLDASNPDATVLGQKMIEAHALRGKMEAIHDKLRGEFKALLNADQLKKLEAFESEHSMRRGGDFGEHDDD